MRPQKDVPRNYVPGVTSLKKELTDGQRAYEQKRADKAGVSLDKHLAGKQRAAEQARAAAAPPPMPKKPGLVSRLIDRASKPLKKSG